jgi:hypothetical protein
MPFSVRLLLVQIDEQHGHLVFSIPVLFAPVQYWINAYIYLP